MANDTNIIYIYASIGIVFFILILYLFLKMYILQKKYNAFMSGVDGDSLENLLKSCITQINELKNENKSLIKKHTELKRDIKGCIQKIGIIRYCAFENTGSDQSFSIVLLDGDNNGFVISGLNAREFSSSYAKPVVDGKSSYPLSTEEKHALNIAMQTKGNGKL